MPRKIILLVLAALLLFSSGCAAVIEGEYSSSSVHESSNAEAVSEAEVSVDVSSYSELYAAVQSFVEDGVEYGLVLFDGYEGKIEDDLSNVCIAVANNTPIGAYAVYYINYSLNKIVSYYEADITVVYKRNKEAIESIVTIETADELYDYVKSAMESRNDRFAVYTENSDLDTDSVSASVDEVYYSNPDTMLYYPKYSVSRYPESGDKCILEVTMSFPYTVTTVENRKKDMLLVADKIISGIDAADTYGQLEQIYQYLAENVTFDEQLFTSETYSRWYNSYTAYGALVMKKAVGEGYALAVRLLCDRLGIECYVVRGRINGQSHAWNIVGLGDGQYYHLDSSKGTDEGMKLLGDNEMQPEYWWDTAEYVACVSPESDEPELPDDPDLPENENTDTQNELSENDDTIQDDETLPESASTEN
jgi:hypothetical protein